MTAVDYWEIPGQMDLLDAARTARDDGIAKVEAASDDWQRDAIDQAIRAFAQLRQPFSANEIRPLLPEGIRPALLGARFNAAARRGVIRRVGFVQSTEPGTHAAWIKLWVGH